MKRGFTLVELSIVLVIIGLLVGGILVGQSLIDAAKTGKLVRDLAQYEASINLFKSKFKYYPGDSSGFTPRGRADNELSWGSNGSSANCASSPNNLLSNSENFQVWAHLSQSQMLKASYVAYSPVSCGGPHSDDYDEAARLVKNLGPLTEYDQKAKAYFGGDRNGDIIAVNKGEGQNLYLEFYVGGITVLALEGKLGSQADDYSHVQVGLVNSVGIGKCYDEEDSQVGCAEDTAQIGRMYYYLAPL